MCDVSSENSEASAHQNNNESVHLKDLSPSILEAFHFLTKDGPILDYDLSTMPISGVGENSYGLVLQVKLTPTRTLPTLLPVEPYYCVLKISPKNPARRQHMKVADYYYREVFMYEKVLSVYEELHKEQQSCLQITPKMLHYSLKDIDEFIIFEDLTRQAFITNKRNKIPNYDLVKNTLQTLGKFHAMSFVLQARKPDQFRELVATMHDNLFNEDIEAVSIEFGKQYVRRTRSFLEQMLEQSMEVKTAIRATQLIEDNFKEICLQAVNGVACAPFAAICHGDFWNNNILYKFDADNKPTATRLIDFQMSRYAPPVLDILHYLFSCTEKSLRDAHFKEFMEIYHNSLAQQIHFFGLDAAKLYPVEIFRQQLQQYGAYGFCMAAFGVVFYITDTSEMFDLNEVSEAIAKLPEGNMEDEDQVDTQKATEQLLGEYDLLTPRTLPIFKERMTGVALDLVKYNMVETLFKRF